MLLLTWCQESKNGSLIPNKTENKENKENDRGRDLQCKSITNFKGILNYAILFLQNQKKINVPREIMSMKLKQKKNKQTNKKQNKVQLCLLIKTTDDSSKGPQSNSQHQHGDSHDSVTSIPGNLPPAYDLCWYL